MVDSSIRCHVGKDRGSIIKVEVAVDYRGFGRDLERRLAITDMGSAARCRRL